MQDDIGYDQTSDESVDSDVDSYEEIEKMYDNLERRKRKIERMKEEIMKMYGSKKKFVFNVYNVSCKKSFETKMKKDFEYLEYTVLEEDKDEDCLVVEVERTMAEDFLNIEGCQIGNGNVAVFLDKTVKEKPKKTGTWDNPPKKTGTWDDAPKKSKPKDPQPDPPKKTRKRLINN